MFTVSQYLQADSKTSGFPKPSLTFSENESGAQPKASTACSLFYGNVKGGFGNPDVKITSEFFSQTFISLFASWIIVLI